jgi:hypothetical protein
MLWNSSRRPAKLHVLSTSKPMMKKSIALLFCVFMYSMTSGQAPVDAMEGPYTLKDRFAIMKDKSQTYQNYKVIKESVLDGVWKIVQDSLKAKDVAVRNANQQIRQLRAEVTQVQQAMKQKDESVKDVMYDSEHINVLGIDFGKGFFLGFVGILLAGLIGFLAFIMARMRYQDKSMREKTLTINMVTNEYEEYKRKAMEKQTKLSRELQDERNRLQELRRS